MERSGNLIRLCLGSCAVMLQSAVLSLSASRCEDATESSTVFRASWCAFTAWNCAVNTKGSDHWVQNSKLWAQNIEIPVLLTSLEHGLGAKRPCSPCHSNSSSCWVSPCSALECCAGGGWLWWFKGG